MKFDDLTIREARELVRLLGGQQPAADIPTSGIDNGMIGKYVIVRCRDAGVHAGGYLEAYNGRSCVLRDGRRLWYWRPANGAAFLSGVAVEGLAADSKIGAAVRTHLTENCEILECSKQAEISISEAPNYEP